MTGLINKTLAATAAAALVLAPASFADGTIPSDLTPTGKRDIYAHEGFYASIRARYQSESPSDSSGISSTGIFGVQSTIELGGGLQGFLRYETTSGGAQGSALQTRLAHVGLRGDFGEMKVGSVRPKSYRWVHGVTDVGNFHTGNIIGSQFLPVRQNKALEYVTPDFHGLSLAAFAVLDGERDAEGRLSPATGTGISVNLADPSRTYPELQDLTAITDPSVTEDFLLRLANPTRIGGVLFYRQPHYVRIPIPISSAPGAAWDPRVITITDGRGDSYLILDAYNDGFVRNSADYVIFVLDFSNFEGNTRDGNDIANFGGNPKDDNDIDFYSVAAKYAVNGFSVGAAAMVKDNGIPNTGRSYTYQNNELLFREAIYNDDWILYTFSLSYEQDNWFVSGWAGKDNLGDSNFTDLNSNKRFHRDNQYLSAAAGMSVNNINLYAIYESQDISDAPTGANRFITLGAQYNFNERSRFWLEYAGEDLDAPLAHPNALGEDYFVIGMRYDL